MSEASKAAFKQEMDRLEREFNTILDRMGQWPGIVQTAMEATMRAARMQALLDNYVTENRGLRAEIDEMNSRKAPPAEQELHALRARCQVAEKLIGDLSGSLLNLPSDALVPMSDVLPALLKAKGELQHGGVAKRDAIMEAVRENVLHKSTPVSLSDLVPARLTPFVLRSVRAEFVEAFAPAEEVLRVWTKVYSGWSGDVMDADAQAAKELTEKLNELVVDGRKISVHQ